MVGRPASPDRIFAQKHGMTRQMVKRLGGAARLELLAPEILALLIKPNYGFSRGLRVGGLTKRGMKRAKDIRTNDEVAA